MLQRIRNFFVTVFEVIVETRAMQAEYHLKHRNLSE